MSVLENWLAERGPDAMMRAGITPKVDAIFPENGSSSGYTPDQLARMLGASVQSKSGQAVTDETAMRQATVYACTGLLSGAIASLPFNTYERTKTARRKIDHPYWWFLNESASDEWSSAVAMEYLQASKFLYGDGFAKLNRRNPFTSEALGYTPYHPDRVCVFREHGTYGRRLYRFTEQDGTMNTLTDEDVIHLTSLGFDGLRSPSPITWAAKEAVGNALAAEEFSARFFSNGSTHDIALTLDKNLNEKQLTELRASYANKYTGGNNNRAPLVLTGGLKVEKLSITPQDAALLPTRQFTVEEICRIFGVPPFMVGHTDKTTSWGSGVEAMGTGFVRYALRRHIIQTQQEFNRKLFPVRQRIFVAFDLSDLTRADFKTRMEGYRIALGRAGEQPWMTVDEVRDAELMEPAGIDEITDVAKTAAANSAANNPPDNSSGASGSGGSGPEDLNKEPKQ